MSDKIWFSDFLERAGQYYYYQFPEDLMPRDDVRKLRSALRRGVEYNFSGLPNKMVEKLLFGSKNRKLKHALAIDTFYVDDAMCDVLSGFNLGKTRLHPVSLYDKTGTVKQHEGQYHMVLMQEPRDTFDLALGGEQGWIKADRGPSGILTGYYITPLDIWPKHLVPGFAPDVDLWCDSVVQGTLFFSDRLKRALVKARYGGLFKFVECK
jgi:hypothetical protein